MTKNNNTKKIVIASAIILTVTGIILWATGVFKKDGNNGNGGDENTGDKGSGSGTGTNKETCDNFKIKFPIKKGHGVSNICERPWVKGIQSYLNANLKVPMALLVVDGKFGSKTKTALVQITGKDTVSQSEYNQMLLFQGRNINFINPPVSNS